MIELSARLKAAVAKSDRENGFGWLPFWMHSLDTAGIMEKLANNRLPKSIKTYLGAECGGEETLLRTLKFCALVHDIGKLTAVFQSRIRDAVEFSPFAEYVDLPKSSSFERTSETPHALASEAILLHFECLRGIASIAGAHHGKPTALAADVRDQIEGGYKNPDNFYGRGMKYKSLFESLWKEWLDFSLESAGFSDLSALPDISVPAQVVISGMLITADWIASNTTYFPLISADEQGQFSDYPERTEAAWNKIHFTDIWNSTARFGFDDEAFLERFGFLPNTTQAEIISTAADADSAGIYIIEAPMGLGKTEAALALSEILAAKVGAGGLFFGMPTQATSNGIFPRLEKWAGGLADDNQTLYAVRLAHGAAALNEDYRELFTGHSNLAEETEQGLIVHDWFSGRKQALLSDFVIGTVDQLLMAALKQKHVMLKHFGLSGKVVVVDECHAYDAYMSKYLDMAIQWLGIYKVPVIILSATLPAKRRAELVEAYVGRGLKCADDAWKSSLAYPLLTYTEKNFVKQKALSFSGEQKEISVKTIHRDEVTARAGYAAECGGCVGVIVNTVRKAQEIAAELQSALPECEVIIMHAQFIMTDRAKKEEQILSRVGKRSTPESRRGLIIVGTQVLEQSLDIDFDLMITELCPMDLLLQRTGRLHRHNRPRPQGLENAECFVIDEAGADFDAGSAAIYGEWLLMRTRALLPDRLTIPKDIPLLVQRVYDENDNRMLGKLTEGMESAREEDEKKAKKKERNASNWLIGKPSERKGKSLDGWLDNDIDSSSEQAGERAVRDGDPSIDVIALMRDAEGQIHTVSDECERVIPADRPPSRAEALLIARQKLRLPGFFGRRWNIDSTITQLVSETKSNFSAWQDSALLKEELVLLFDNELNAALGEVRLHYDIKTGLTYEKE